MGSIEEERPFIEKGSVLQEVKLYAEDGSVDINGNPPLKQKTGNWKACPFILGKQCCERLAYYGIAKNLITYFTTELHETNVSGAKQVMIWQGTCYITPLLGALIADSYSGRYWTIASFSAIYFFGMATLTLSASLPSLKPATKSQYAVFYIGLYLIALGTGGIKPCVSSFGADQFDDTYPYERASKASFFNWFYFSINIGAFISSTLLVYVQENCGWGLGFLIPTLVMGLSLVSFFSGTPLYRFQKPGNSPITSVCQVLVASYRKQNLKEDNTLLFETLRDDKIEHTDGYKKSVHRKLIRRFLDRAALISEDGVSSNQWELCTVTQVEEVKILLRLFPIWVSGIVFSALHSQIYTLFVQQGRSMERVSGSFEIPPATLGMFDTASVLICVPIYDRLFVPFVRRFTGRAKGFTDLQRMGLRLVASVSSMATAAIVETERLRMRNLNIFWQMLQYFLMGTAEVFFNIGQLEFYYEQAPDAMRSLCSALPLLSSAFGSYLSSLILTLVAYFTTMDGGDGWVHSEDLDGGHLDYFFRLLVCLGCVNIPVFVFFSMKHLQKKATWVPISSSVLFLLVWNL
ncbi:unnamed protein product [Microthlaspi erraticum]|uniref:Major facilitator superfamily (MFS) profile domain-containing protein n=1 Tax=Microthlaspi erraticum TaxID=1685480 RepID=A0A6D2JV71_9BRAS|nr:unnamed protein product [Microthlaspi erraticum]